MQIYYSKQSEKFLKKIDKVTRERILNAIHKLPEGDVKKLQGQSGYRLRIGDYRVVFDANRNIIYVLRIDSRGQIYK